MTKTRTATVTCSACGKESSFCVYDTINSKLNPELKEKLYTEESPLIFTCPHCGEKTFVCYDFLFHDMDHHYMIWFVPSGKKPQSPSEELKRVMGGDLADKVMTLSKGYRYRYVEDIDELLEKIIELDSAYPDYVWEILKVLYCAKLREDKGLQVENFRVRMVDGDKLSCTFTLGDEDAFVDISTEALDVIATGFQCDETDECIQVNEDWATRALQSRKVKS